MATFEEIQKKNLQNYINQTKNQDAAARLAAWNQTGKDPGIGYKANSQPRITASQNTGSDALQKYMDTINSGYGNAQDEARRLASQQANEQRNRLNSNLQDYATQRETGLKRVDNSLADAKQSLEDTSFQRYLASRQSIANRGLSGSGLAQDADTRLSLARQRDLAGIERDAATQRYALDESYNNNSKSIYDQLNNINEDSLYTQFYTQLRAQAAQEQAQKAAQLMQYIQLQNQMQQQDYARQVDQRNFDYQAGRDQVGDKQWNQQFDYKQLQDYLDNQKWKQQFDRNALENDRNFDYQKNRDQVGDQRWNRQFNADQAYRYDNLNQDNYWKNLDLQYRYDNLYADQDYRNRQMSMNERELTLKEQQIMKDMEKEKDNFVKTEVSDMLGAMRSGQVTPQEAYRQIEQDKQAGVYTKDQADKLQSVLRNYAYQNVIPGPPSPSDFNNKQKGGGYSNYYKTQKSAKANPTSYKSVNNTLSQAIQQTGVPESWLPALVELTARESSWNPNAKNPKSSARGLFQFLDSTRKNYAWNGVNWNDPLHQSIAGIRYVKDRYGTPEKALQFWDKNKWY